MRISDRSSDVCSSDLNLVVSAVVTRFHGRAGTRRALVVVALSHDYASERASLAHCWLSTRGIAAVELVSVQSKAVVATVVAAVGALSSRLLGSQVTRDLVPVVGVAAAGRQIGNASCRARVCQY